MEPRKNKERQDTKLRGASCTRDQGSERKSAGKQTPVVWTSGTKGTGLLWKSSRTNRNSRKKKARDTNAYVEVENKKNDMKDLGLNQAMALDREVWRRKTFMADPTTNGTTPLT